MKKFLVTIAMLLTLGLSFQGVAAQVEAPEVDGMEFSEIDGLQTVYGRTYSVDFMAMMSSPEANLEEMDTAAMMRSISIQGYTFENEDQAKDFVETMKEEAEGGISEAEEMGEVEIKDLEAVDKDGMTMTMVMNMDDMNIAITMHIFADGNQVFMVSSTDTELEATGTSADAVAQYVVDAESESDEVAFNEDGTSTGGVFDRMPQVGDELVADLTAMDIEAYTGE